MAAIDFETSGIITVTWGCDTSTSIQGAGLALPDKVVDNIYASNNRHANILSRICLGKIERRMKRNQNHHQTNRMIFPQVPEFRKLRPPKSIATGGQRFILAVHQSEG